MTTASGDMGYDRRAPDLLRLLGGAEGPLTDLVHRCQDDLTDLHVRRQPFGARSWISLYVGMTTVLDVELSGDRFRLRAHKTHRANGAFNDDWLDPVPLEELIARWPAVAAYLDRVIPTVAERHTAKEGRVHAALCSGRSNAYAVADREAAVGFRDASTKSEICQPVEQAIYKAVLDTSHEEPWWPGNDRKFKPLGTGLDILATDPAGRLLAIEAKPPSSLNGIAWGPAQVRFYAEIFAAWLHVTPNSKDIIDGLSQQRVDLGLSDITYPLSASIKVVPVLAIGAGRMSTQALGRAVDLRQAIAEFPPGPQVEPAEIWLLDEDGDPIDQM